MAKNILIIITSFLVMIHLSILYFWFFDWEKLVTEIGLFSWGGSIILGIILFPLFTGKRLLVLKRTLFVSTFMTILLAIFAFIIEFITSSMP